MSTFTGISRKFNWKAALIVAIILTVVGLLTNPSAPLGKFWAVSPDEPTPTSVQMPLFMILVLVESLTFGAGIAFLFFGFPLVKSLGSVSTRMMRAAHLSIAWLMFSWFPHDSLHKHNGTNLNGLLGIEYGFHLTLMITGVILAIFFLKLLQQSKQPLT